MNNPTSELPVPESPSAWSLDHVKKLIKLHPHETDWFDYKISLTPMCGLKDEKKREEHRHTIRKCCCAFANTRGGCILFGIKREIDAKDRIAGIDLSDDLTEHLQGLLKDLDPNIRQFNAFGVPLKAESKSLKGVWIVKIPASEMRPHMTGGRFYKRSAGGTCDIMTAQEVRDQIMYREDRLKKIGLLRMELHQLQMTNNDMRHGAGHAHNVAVRLSATSLRILIADTISMLTPELTAKLLQLATKADDQNRRYDWEHEAFAMAKVMRGQFGQLREGHVHQSAANDIKQLIEECASALGNLYPKVEWAI